MKSSTCLLKKQGFSTGSCQVKADGQHQLACRVTLKHEKGKPYRLITSVNLSRPENYLSIYQSGCNFSCRKCHSWYFSKVKNGAWYKPEDILKMSMAYEQLVNLREPREKATAWDAHQTCRCCGSCIVNGRRSSSCPGVLAPEAILLSPQGFGPARNIVAFTGGDLTCCPEFYEECTRLIKAHTNLWVLIESNGYGLTSQNLDRLKASGVDAFWLDIKAWEEKTHRWLTGCANKRILDLPEQIIQRGFVLEVLSLYIPDVVECDQLEKIANHLAAVDPHIPFTILAFFPEHRMRGHRSPNISEMIAAYQSARDAGLKNIRLGNLGVFAKTDADRRLLARHVGSQHI
jgi:pyruvate-formate lyase-activating enzyme